MSSEKTRIINDTFSIVDVGYRNEQPVALVEKKFSDNSKEYIIAFDYSINDDNINWGYGYYYNENIEKAKEDFNRVLKGENLADTFEEKNDLNEEFSFSKLLETINTMFSGQCQDKGLDYQCHINGQIDDYYIGDNMKIRQVLINILSNAFFQNHIPVMTSHTTQKYRVNRVINDP